MFYLVDLWNSAFIRLGQHSLKFVGIWHYLLIEGLGLISSIQNLVLFVTVLEILRGLFIFYKLMETSGVPALDGFLSWGLLWVCCWTNFPQFSNRRVVQNKLKNVWKGVVYPCKPLPGVWGRPKYLICSSWPMGKHPGIMPNSRTCHGRNTSKCLHNDLLSTALFSPHVKKYSPYW